MWKPFSYDFSRFWSEGRMRRDSSTKPTEKMRWESRFDDIKSPSWGENSPPVRWGLLDFMSLVLLLLLLRLLLSFSSPTAMMCAQCCVPDLNHDCVRQCCVPDLNQDHAISVLRAGPQQRRYAASVARRTSTETMWVQCGASDRNHECVHVCGQCCVPDLQRDHVASLWCAGPQLRHVSESRMSERLSEEMSQRMSKEMSERMSKDMSERISERMSERMNVRNIRKAVYSCQVIDWHVLACLYWHVYAVVFDYCLFIYVWQVFSWHE